VPLNRLDVVVSRKASVSVHDKSDMLRDRALLKGANEELPQLADAPNGRRRRCEPFADSGVVEGVGHGIVNVGQGKVAKGVLAGISKIQGTASNDAEPSQRY
jgi:hypothetical protein